VQLSLSVAVFIYGELFCLIVAVMLCTILILKNITYLHYLLDA